VLGHRHRAADAKRASFVAGRKHDAAVAWRPNKRCPSTQRRIIELLNRRVERIHIGVSDNPWPSSF
jgi:hypothetical protein